MTETVIHCPHPADTLKMVREALCLAQSAIIRWPADEDRKREHITRLGRLIDDIDRQRPIGPDGKHGDRHTATCGCEDESAIATVARHYIAKAVRDAKDFDRIAWEDYPELCAVDFDRVGNLAVGIAAGLEDNPAAYDAAYALLAARASDQEPQP